MAHSITPSGLRLAGSSRRDSALTIPHDGDPREDEHPLPYLNLFSRLEQHLPEYRFDREALFHSSYDNWHVVGHGHTHVVARISQNDLLFELEFKQAQILSNDPAALEYFIRPIQLVRMPAQRPGEVNLIVSVVEAPSLNYIEEIKLLKLPPPHITREAPSLSTFLDLAIGCCACLEILHHKQNRVHGELRLDAFHFNITTGAVRLINLGSGIRSFTDRLMSTGWTSLLSERGIRYKLQFFAPEQTGKLAAEPDKRTDIYALGVGFWSYLAGNMPYKESDPLEIIQSVLSQKLRSIAAMRPEIPRSIVMVLTKMTNKAMNERYNSISSVKHDLQQIKELLGSGDHKALDDFVVAQDDISASFTLPNLLIGRQKEMKVIMESVTASLIDIHTNVVEFGSTETVHRRHSNSASPREVDSPTHIISVSGERGMGKTFFIRNAQQNIRHKALVVTTQFESTGVQRLDPILKLISAVFRQLFSEPDVQTMTHKAIRQQVGPHWRSICKHLELPPWLLDFEHCTTPPDEDQRATWADPVNGSQTSRFMQVLLQVLRVIANQRPLYLCLDDVDLADSECLDLLQALISARLSLILVVTYNPARASEQLNHLIETATKIDLGPFSEEETAQYVGATVGANESLAAIVYDRTGGGPGYVRNFLERCYNAGYISFSWQKRRWKIEMEKVAQCWPATNDPEKLIEQMILSRFRRLPEDVRSLLCWASLTGKRFAFSNLQDILQFQDPLGSLQTAVSKYIIRPTSDENIFEFSDSNTYGAFYVLANECNVQEMHLALANSMLSKRNSRVYDMAEHITNCIDIIKQPKERYMDVLLEASEMAKTIGSSRKSAFFCDAAMRLIDGDDWSSGHLQLYTHAAEVYQMVNRLDESLRLLTIIERKVDTLQDRVPMLVTRSRIYGAQGDSCAAFEIIKAALAELDSNIIPPSIQACDKIFRAGLNSSGSAVSVTAQPGVETLLAEAIMTSLFVSDCVPYRSAIGLVKQCNSTNSGGYRAIGLLYLSAIALFRLGDVTKSQELRKDAMIIIRNTQTPYDVWSRALVLRTFLFGHVESDDDGRIDRLTHSLENSALTSDRAFTLLNISAIALLRLCTSRHLGDLERFMEHSTAGLSRWSEDLQNSLVLIYVRQVTRALRGKTQIDSADTILCDSEHNTETFLASMQGRRFCYDLYQSARVVAMNLLGYPEEAVKLGLTLLSYTEECRVSLSWTLMFYHMALAIASVLRTPQRSNPYLLGIFNDLRARFEPLARHGTPMHRARLLILDAEIADDASSLRLRDAAIELLRGRSLGLLEGLCIERYIKCLLRMGATNAVQHLVKRCSTIYEKVGATAKVMQVLQLVRDDDELPMLVEDDLNRKDAQIEYSNGHHKTKETHEIYNGLRKTQSWSKDVQQHDTRVNTGLKSHVTIGTLDVIDLHSIISSSQAMTSELQVDRLAQTLTKIIAESTAAELCSIVIEDEDVQGWIVAATQPSSNQERVLEDLEDVARQVNTYVLRFRDHIFIHNTRESEKCANIFPHITEELSVICMPMLHGGTLLGSLYCQAPSDTFTDRTLTLVQLLVAQISISLHNAILFKRLEKASNNNLLMIEMQKDSVKRAQESEKKARLAEAEAIDNLRQKEEAMKAKSLFLANVSHELRTPLNGVIGMTTILQDTQLTGHQLDCTRNIKVCAETLVQIVNDILDYNKLEAGKMMVSNAPMNLYQVLLEVITVLRATHINEDIATIECLDLERNTTIIGDSVRLQQVLMNLMSNAYKFTPKGKVTVSASTKRQGKSIMATISVADSGIGISPEQQHNLFLPFSQADAGTARSYGGTGLGLSICKLIVESVLKGKIWLDSILGEGTTVTFDAEFQIADNDARQIIHRPSIAYAGVRKPLRLKPADIKICIVEDNAINRKIAMSFVKKLGFRYEAYADGKQAVDALVKAKDFHLVLMDVQMPVLDGYDATKAIRRLDGIRDLIVIAMTASSIQGDKERCFQAGMDAYVSKPVRLETLRDAIQSFMSDADGDQ